MRLWLILLLSCFATFCHSQQLSPEQQERIHEFDFWIGEWTVYNYGTETIAGYSHIESIMDSLAIQENYRSPTSAGPYKGTSLNKYNFNKAHWEQYYIDNSGLTLPLEGGMEDGKMILANIQNSQKGSVENRITWERKSDGSVRQTWHSRTEGSEEWTVLFDGHYKQKE